PEVREVPRAYRLDRGEHAVVLGDDVTGPAPEDVRQGLEAVEIGTGQVAQLGNAQETARLFALRAARVVIAGRVVVRDPRVDDDQLRLGRQRDAFVLEGTRVEEQGVALLPETARHRVHDPDLGADELVLHALAQPG